MGVTSLRQASTGIPPATVNHRAVSIGLYLRRYLAAAITPQLHSRMNPTHVAQIAAQSQVEAKCKDYTADELQKKGIPAMSCSELIGEIAEGEMLTPQEACQYNLGSIDPQWNDVLVHNLCCATCNLSPHPGGPTVPPSEQKCKQINDQCLDLLMNVTPECSAGATPAFPYQCKSRLGKC
eukprot:gene11949-15003_t